MSPSGETKDPVQVAMRTVADRTRSIHARSRWVFSAELALSSGKPCTVHMPSSARAPAHTNTSEAAIAAVDQRVIEVSGRVFRVSGVRAIIRAFARAS
jgi:hypothetical protein